MPLPGGPVVDLVRAALLGVQRVSIAAVTITGTDHIEGSLFSHEVRVGKQYLASRMTTLFERGLISLPEPEVARTLADELRYSHRDSFRLFRSGRDRSD